MCKLRHQNSEGNQYEEGKERKDKISCRQWRKLSNVYQGSDGKEGNEKVKEKANGDEGSKMKK